MPKDYDQGSDYTRELKGHLIMLRTCFGMSIEQVGDFLRMNGVAICDGTVSNIVLGEGEALKSEYEEIIANQPRDFVERVEVIAKISKKENWEALIYGLVVKL